MLRNILKQKNILIAAFSVLFFSGCSSTPPDSPNKGKEVFTFSQSIWKSPDGGKTWEVKNTGIGQSNTRDADVLTFAINPNNTSNIYAGLKSGGILETMNGGETWRFINYQSEKVYGLELSPTDGRTLYASGVWEGTGKMFKTQNRGENWTEIYTSAAEGPIIISFAVDERNPSVLYATSSDNQAFKSLDGGVSWKNIYTAEEPILKIALDSANKNVFYMITSRGSVLKSADGGKTFEDMEDKIRENFSGFGGNQFSVLETDPSVSGRLYLAGSGGLAVSSDGGENWEKVYILNDPGKFPVTALAVNPKNSKEIIYGASQAVYRSIDGGANWMASQFYGEKKVNVIKYDPVDPSNIYVGFAE